jgi:GntR family transcriptional regulator
MVAAKQQKAAAAAAAKAVGKNLPVPLYHQIFLLLRDEIISGQRPHGSLVPTEQELSRIYGVSRITTRRALDELAQNRLVERKRRVGTRVIYEPASPPIEASIEQALESLLTLGRTTKVKLMEYADEVGEPSVLAMLHLAPNEHVVRVVRVRWLDNQPLGCVVSYMPSKLGLTFSRAELEAHPMLKLIERTKLKIGTATQTISATSADAALATMLDVEIRFPILRIGRVLCSAAGEPLLYTMAQYRSDRYQIRLDLHSFGDNKDAGADGAKTMSPVLAESKTGPKSAKVGPQSAKAAGKASKTTRAAKTTPQVAKPGPKPAKPEPERAKAKATPAKAAPERTKSSRAGKSSRTSRIPA